MKPLMFLVQIALPALSVLATAFASWRVLNTRFNARKYAPLIGLAVQPFWAYSALNTEPVQPGVIVTCAFFTLTWLVSFWEQWVEPWVTPLWCAMSDGEWGLWWYRSYDTQAQQTQVAEWRYLDTLNGVDYWADTDIQPEQWARHAGPPADGMCAVGYSSAVDQSEDIDRLVEKHKLNTMLRQQKSEGLDWIDTQPQDPSPDGVPWTEDEKNRWYRNQLEAVRYIEKRDLDRTKHAEMLDRTMRVVQACIGFPSPFGMNRPLWIDDETVRELTRETPDRGTIIIDSAFMSDVWKPGPFELAPERIEPHTAAEERFLRDPRDGTKMRVTNQQDIGKPYAVLNTVKA